MKTSPLFFALLLLPSVLAANPFEVTGYLPSYRMESAHRAVGSAVLDLSGYSPAYEAKRRIHQANMEFSQSSFPDGYLNETIELWYGRNVDRLIYFSVIPRKDGTLDTSSLEERDLFRLMNIRQIHGTELNLAVSGDSGHFVPVTNEKETREKFLKELLSFARTYGFTGIDFDWEFPRNEEQLELFNLLIEDASSLFSPLGIRVSAAISRFKPLRGDILAKLDRINLMAYDNHGRHSTYESAVEAAEYLQIKYNVEPEKINLGIPFYGRIYSGLDPQYWTRTKIYRHLDEEYTLSPTQDEAGGFFFNGAGTVRKKTAYARESGLGGIMIWELGQDSMGSNSLLKAIREEIQ